MLLDVAGLDRRLLPLVAVTEVAAKEFDAGGVDLHLLAGRRNRVVVAVALDMPFDHLPIAEQEDTVGRAIWFVLPGGPSAAADKPRR